MLLLAQEQAGLIYEVAETSLAPTEHPDEAALRMAWPRGAAPQGSICHSTSWRRAEDGTLVLTYAAGPVRPRGGSLLVWPAVVTSGDALRPHPAVMHGHHVVAHAVLHLAELARRDPTVRALADDQPLFWARLADIAADTPTAEHDHAHDLAGEGRRMEGAIGFAGSI